MKEGATRDEVVQLLHRHRIEKVLVVNDDFQLRGLITVKDILKAKENPLPCKDVLSNYALARQLGRCL